MWEPKPHVVGFVAGLVFVAGVSTAADRVAEQGPDGITIEDVAAPVDDGLADDARDTPIPSEAPSPTGEVLAQPTDTQPDTEPSPTASAAPAADGTETVTGGGASDDAAAEPEPEPAPAPTTAAPSPEASAPAQPASRFPEAKLYSDSEKVRGITDSRITLCGHAALALGAAFDTSREDLNVYWDAVNDAGGVLGRDVEMTWEDDAYVSDQAVRAATTCADKDPFMILGGIGFDQIPGVRNWAEANDELYLHHIAVAPTKTYDHSFSLSPTVELVGKESGNYIVREHREAKVGVMYRDTDNWKPGSDAGIAVMTSAKMDVTPYPIIQNQGVYSQQLNQMQLAGVEVVWIWENALNAAQIINQADELGYHPTFVVFPFQTTIDILSDPTAHTIEGVASWSSYAPGGYGGAHSSFELDAEIKRFEAAYAKHRPGTTPNDILWQTWVGNKTLHRMLQDCGQDCNRNRFAGMMLSGYQARELPGCEIDFADARSFGGHHGGFRFFTQELFFPKRGAAYRTNDYCARTLK